MYSLSSFSNHQCRAIFILFYPHLPILKLDCFEASLRHNHVKKLDDTKDPMKTLLFSFNQKKRKEIQLSKENGKLAEPSHGSFSMQSIV